MSSDPTAETHRTYMSRELEEMAEAFERREFSEEELEAMRKTRRTTPR